MAESVQYNLERSIPELEQLERVGLFTKREIKQIIKRRKLLDYKIVRVHKAKQNYLKYIQYEIGVLSLIKRRREKLGYAQKKKEIDNVIGRRINDLFTAVVRRYPEDVKLWITHREFLKKMNWHENMSSMLTRMLQIHNKSPELWLAVAKWEWEDSASAETARKLLQRAIRFHDDSPILWREYYRMELLYVEELRKRLNILAAKGTNDTENKNDAILQGKIPLIIYQNAVAKIKDVDFALSFLPICKEFDFTEEHQEAIYQHILNNHKSSETVWNVLALRCLEKSLPEEQQIKKKTWTRRIEEEAFIVFEDAVKSVPTTKMWDYYIQNVLDRIAVAYSAVRAEHLVSKALKLAQRAFDANLLSKEMLLEWIKLLHSTQASAEAQKIAITGTERWPNDPSIWTLRLMLDSQLLSTEEFMNSFDKAVEQVQEKASLPLWYFAIEWATCGTVRHLKTIFEKGILRSSEISIPLKTKYLQLTANVLGIEAARELYQRLKYLLPLSPDFFFHMVEIEKCKANPKIQMIRRCYEDGILEFGRTSVDMWLEYARLELEYPQGQAVAVGNIYRQAVKTLEPAKCDEFIAQYTLMTSSSNANV